MLLNKTQEEEARQSIRRLLGKWGQVTCYCARKHREIEEYDELIESAADIRPQQLCDMPKGNGTSDPTPQAADRMSGLEERYRERIKELTEDIGKELDFARAIDGATKVLSAIESVVIDLKYKRENQYEQIARKTGYCLDSVKKIERAAIDKLREVIKIELL